MGELSGQSCTEQGTKVEGGPSPMLKQAPNPLSEATGTFSVISFMEATVVTSKWPLLRL